MPPDAYLAAHRKPTDKPRNTDLPKNPAKS
jgi:hypothetical protein